MLRRKTGDLVKATPHLPASRGVTPAVTDLHAAVGGCQLLFRNLFFRFVTLVPQPMIVSVNCSCEEVLFAQYYAKSISSTARPMLPAQRPPSWRIAPLKTNSSLTGTQEGLVPHLFFDKKGWSSFYGINCKGRSCRLQEVDRNN